MTTWLTRVIEARARLVIVDVGAGVAVATVRHTTHSVALDVHAAGLSVRAARPSTSR